MIFNKLFDFLKIIYVKYSLTLIVEIKRIKYKRCNEQFSDSFLKFKIFINNYIHVDCV